MPRQRLTTIVALFALGSCWAGAPTASASSTLLSGYGGPGEGNQAILGSTLIGGSGGSRGGGGSSSTGSSAPQTVSIEAGPAPSATPHTGGSGGQKASGAGTPRAHPRRPRATHTSTPAGATAPAKAVEVRAVSAPALGLSGTDVAHVVLAFLVLVLTAVVTVVLTRGERNAQGGRGETGSG